MLDSHLSFTADPNEWTGAEVTFEVAPHGDRTEVRFAHLGLVPTVECYEKCARAWSFYVDSLRRLITTGKGKPNTE